MMKLTPKQKDVLDRLPEEGPIWCRGSAYEFVKTGKPLSVAVVNNLRKKNLLEGGNDSLLPDNDKPQTLHAAQ